MMTCPAGTIRRSAYYRTTRKAIKAIKAIKGNKGNKTRRTYVKSACITDVGNPGKGLPSGEPGIGPLRKGDLARFGYDHVISMSERRRHLALTKAIKSYGALSLSRKLNAIYVYTRNTSPASSAIFKADRDWVLARLHN